MRRRWRLWRRQPARVRLACASIGVVAIGWPCTAVLQALGWPVFEQVMLALSWLAPAYTAVDMLFTAQLHQDQQDDTDRPK